MNALSLWIVPAAALRSGAPAASLLALARSAAHRPADLLAGGGGWLDRLATLAAAPFALDLYVAGARGEGWRELDAFALATVYGQVLWDDRMGGWHAESGRPDSAERLRELHDLALRCYRHLGEGERLVLVDVPPD